VTTCAICEVELDTADRQSIRLSSSQPPWRARSAIVALGESFAATMRAVRGEPEVTLWFHRDCWHGFLELLTNSQQGAASKGAPG
jgi:hypothetical protein